jgi:hypothetical protein
VLFFSLSLLVLRPIIDFPHYLGLPIPVLYGAVEFSLSSLFFLPAWLLTLNYFLTRSGYRGTLLFSAVFTVGMGVSAKAFSASLNIIDKVLMPSILNFLAVVFFGLFLFLDAFIRLTTLFTNPFSDPTYVESALKTFTETAVFGEVVYLSGVLLTHIGYPLSLIWLAYSHLTKKGLIRQT